MLKLALGLVLSILGAAAVLFVYLYRNRAARRAGEDVESGAEGRADDPDAEDLLVFRGGEDLTICDILDAPGEVIGKSNYGTLYKALLQRSGAVRLLRFMRPACAQTTEEFEDGVRLLGCLRHPNLVPLLGFYTGPRGERLLIHPFYGLGNLAEFIAGGSREARSWSIIYRISTGIARGLDHLHTGWEKPIIHGNLKAKNILLDRSYQPCVSDFGLHLLLNPTAAQEMLEASATEGYKGPELIKMKEASRETDIYSLGVIFLEMVTGKEAVDEKAPPDEDPYLPNSVRKAILNHRMEDMYHPDILLCQTSDQVVITEDAILKFVHLAVACCSPSPSLRPNIRQVLRKLEEI